MRFISLAIIWVCLLPAGVSAQSPGSITIRYRYGGTVFPDRSVSLYKLGELNGGVLTMMPGYTRLEIPLDGTMTAAEMEELCSLASRTAAGKSAYRTEKTNSDGDAVFSDLVPGIYLADELTVSKDRSNYCFAPTIILIPETGDQGVVACPKGERTGDTQQTYVLELRKSWSDAGYQAFRPKQISVNLYCSRILYKTVILSADNNWYYTWDSTESPDRWTVEEASFLPYYQATYSRSGNSFRITNTRYSGSNPKTGDTAHIELAACAVAVSGTILTIQGIVWLRKRKERRDRNDQSM